MKKRRTDITNMIGFAMKQEDHYKKINRIIAKCWSDDSFKDKLLVDPAATLKHNH